VILDLLQLNRDTYNRVREWFDHLDANRKALMISQLEEYPACDDLTEGSSNNIYLFDSFEKISENLQGIKFDFLVVQNETLSRLRITSIILRMSLQ
jgi:hypothetical protein